jgi:outer membrane receptor for ferrienterochelin and colicins
MKRLIIALAAMMLFPAVSQSQKLMGLVIEIDEKGGDQPLPGANVYWLGTTKGTSTKDNGIFLIDRVPESTQLVVSFVGYRSDTILVTDQSNIKVILKSDQELQAVTVEGWRPTTGFDQASNINLVTMNEKELFKAACCNLSESFETNPAVDVAFTDAITGTKQIQMLGLAGPNTMISLENMPGVRGLASSQGIQFIPGTWINSIQVTKGTGSVVNGYESIAGQINVELKKPQESDKLYLNGYISNSARSEANVIVTAQAGKKWATTFLLHGSMRPFEMDQNKDSFLDFPTGNQTNVINRWVYNSGKGLLFQVSLKYLNDYKQGGQTGFDREDDKFTTNRYGLEISTKRTELVTKLGYNFPSKPYQSIGFQLSLTDHQHDSYYGFNVHDARQQSLYANLIYQSIIKSTAHKFKTGVSFMMDGLDEDFKQYDPNGINLPSVYDFDRTEIVPGAFAEYEFDNSKKFSMTAGARVDYYNLFGVLFVPRLHTRYNITQTTTLRLNAGRGIRLANILAENTGFMASSRVFNRANTQTSNAYGFKPDMAWNYGMSFTQDFNLNYRPGIFSLDYYFTDFENQVVADYDNNVREVTFFGLTGRSFSHSAQVQLDYQPIRRLDVRLAYRWLKVETDYLNGRLARPLIPSTRAFINVAYATKSKWKFDVTVQRIGEQRVPNTQANPSEYQLPEYSDPYYQVATQLTKDFGKRWSAYVGIENLTNFRLSNPILAANEPYVNYQYFDASMVWGPVFGRMWYGGFRYRVN